MAPKVSGCLWLSFPDGPGTAEEDVWVCGAVRTPFLSAQPPPLPVDRPRGSGQLWVVAGVPEAQGQLAQQPSDGPPTPGTLGPWGSQGRQHPLLAGHGTPPCPSPCPGAAKSMHCPQGGSYLQASAG